MAGACPGSIYRIALENFVTFKNVELFPGPNLNMIIGPNGTGKSTFVCAIVLGLCGKTSVIGRAKKIGEYVKRGCKEAFIEIELHSNVIGKKVIITRQFNLENSSIWSIDKKGAKEKQVQELIASLNIRVDNLCQLLPQDRVQDFAKMNPQELLKSTQLAVSGQEGVSILEELIQFKSNQRNSLDKLKSNILQLHENKQASARLETILRSMEELNKIKKETEMCEKKKLWSEYEHLKAKVNILDSDKTEAMKLLKICEEKLLPLDKSLKKLDLNNKTLETQRKKYMISVSALKKKINDLLEVSEGENGKIEEIQCDLQAKISQHANKRRDIEQARATLTKIQNDRDNLIKTYGDEFKLKRDMADIHKPITAANKVIAELKSSKMEIQEELDSRITPQIRLYQSKLNSLSDANNKRLEVLRNYSDHSYQALQWLRKNREQFSGNVYEPMILELTFSDPAFAKYLENTVAGRDLVAFTFENSNDMNLFLKKVRVEMNLKRVNAVCSSPSNQTFNPPIEIEQLRNLGFHTYLIDAISGPDAILQFLCKQYGIHKIPIGNDLTFKMSQKVPKEINSFYSENHKFAIRFSAYSGEKSTSTFEIRPAKLLANTIDYDLINQVKEQLKNVSAQQESKKQNIKKIDDEILQHDDNLNNCITKRHKIHESLEQVKTILSRVRMQQNKISTLENEPAFDVESERVKYKAEIEKCVKNQIKLQTTIFNLYNQLYDEIIVTDILGLNLKAIYDKILQIQTKIRDMRSQTSNIENTLSNINQQLSNAKSTAKEKLIEAKKATGKFLPHENGFPYVEEFSKLPCDLNDIQEHLAMLQARIECMEDVDENVAEEYKTRQKAIKTLTSEINLMESDCQNAEKKMNDLRQKWLNPLEEQIVEINKKFGDMFAQLGCAGEVRLSKTGADDDYDKYGISILVRFREEENLQQLTQHQQSGGERALATALYLMALQQLSKAPFRCVDEVNQGMDPINERKMFQLLVKITTECDVASQYFLLTPKLLYSLDYSPSIKVHTIMNGPRAVEYNKWNFKKFIDNATKFTNLSS